MPPVALRPHRACAEDIAQSFLFTAPAGQSPYPASDLRAPASALNSLAAYFNLHQGGYRAALVSMWSQWYFARLITPWTRINLCHGWQLPIGLGQVAFTLGEMGVPEQFILAGAGREIAPGTDFYQSLRPLVEDHLRPLCRSLSELAGIKPGLFWNNAAIRVDHGITLASELGANTAAAREFLDERQLPDGSANPFYRPVRRVATPEGTEKSVRRLCCLRYKIDQNDYCPSCPLLEANQCKSRRKSG